MFFQQLVVVKVWKSIFNSTIIMRWFKNNEIECIMANEPFGNGGINLMVVGEMNESIFDINRGTFEFTSLIKDCVFIKSENLDTWDHLDRVIEVGGFFHFIDWRIAR